MLLQRWSDVLSTSFQNIGYGVINFIPNLLVAIIIFIVGWFIGSVLGRWISQLIRSLKIDQALHSVGTAEMVERAGFRLDVGAFIGALVKWFVIVVFLVASMDVLGLTEINAFLQRIVFGFLPNVIIATFVLILGAMIANALQRIVVGSARAAGVPSAGFLGAVTHWAVWLFAIIAALFQLGVAAVLLQTIFTGLIAMLAIAGGLAFGLGGRDAAASYLDRMRDDMGRRRS